MIGAFTRSYNAAPAPPQAHNYANTGSVLRMPFCTSVQATIYVCQIVLRQAVSGGRVLTPFCGASLFPIEDRISRRSFSPFSEMPPTGYYWPATADTLLLLPGIDEAQQLV